MNSNCSYKYDDNIYINNSLQIDITHPLSEKIKKELLKIIENLQKKIESASNNKNISLAKEKIDIAIIFYEKENYETAKLLLSEAENLLNNAPPYKNKEEKKNYEWIILPFVLILILGGLYLKKHILFYPLKKISIPVQNTHILKQAPEPKIILRATAE